MKKKQIFKFSTFLLILFFIGSCEREPIQNPIIETGVVIEIISGNNQHGVIGERLVDSVIVRVVDKAQVPISGLDITFSVLSGAGVISNQNVKSNAIGEASVAWTLGAGPEQILKVNFDKITEANPLYIFANNQIAFEPKWVSNIQINTYNTRLEHDNRILESNNFLTFSDAVSDDVKVIFAKMAEESLFEIKQTFNIRSSEEIGVSTSNIASKIKIYTVKNARYSQVAFKYGFVLYGIGSPMFEDSGRGDFFLRREIIHETMHVFQFLVGPDPYEPPFIDTWFTEGIAEYISGGASTPISTYEQWNSWLQVSSHITPIKIHQWTDFPDPTRTAEYYPPFGLAIKYLLDRNGLGKSYEDVKAMFIDMRTSNSFNSSFEKYMGITVTYYEEHFNDLISEFLRK